VLFLIGLPFVKTFHRSKSRSFAFIMPGKIEKRRREPITLMHLD
jgi:hypothetical protein